MIIIEMFADHYDDGPWNQNPIKFKDINRKNVNEFALLLESAQNQIFRENLYFVCNQLSVYTEYNTTKKKPKTL